MLDKILDNLVEKERKANGRESHTTMVIVDSKSIKNTSTAKEKGYDVEKTSGIKRACEKVSVKREKRTSVVK